MFYVYTLSDPRNGKVFYVGKGKGNRAYQHANEARRPRPSNPRKAAIIRDIHAWGLEPTVTMVERYEKEEDAYLHEADLIATLPDLTNIVAGGELGQPLTPEEVERRRAEAEEREKERRNRKSVECLRNWLKTVESWPHGVTFPNLDDGEAKADEFVRIVRELVAAGPNI